MCIILEISITPLLDNLKKTAVGPLVTMAQQKSKMDVIDLVSPSPQPPTDDMDNNNNNNVKDIDKNLNDNEEDDNRYPTKDE